MCGILGYIGNKPATEILIEGLRRLEYRGYDSSGVAVLSKSGLQLRRAVGKLSKLEALLAKSPISGHMGLGHTRWATHGAPSEVNAHPHMDPSGRIVVVHNGIIENYLSLKEKLLKKRIQFKSDTDTEVVANLIGSYLKDGKADPIALRKNFLDAIKRALKEIRGTYALGIIHTKIPDLLVGARRDCPLIAGLGDGENFLASDVPAILSHTRDVVFLEEGEMAVLTKEKAEFFDEKGRKKIKTPTKISWDPIQAEKAGYTHFMLKEIHEQSRVVEDTLLGRLDINKGSVELPEVRLSPREVEQISRIRFVACGTSWHAALVGGYLIERYLRIPCQVEIASEFRYRSPVMDSKTLLVAISQSGETADTLAALRLGKKLGLKTLGIANVVGSSLTREADSNIMTHCGPEIGVASTKAFMGQLVALHLLMLYLGTVRNALPKKVMKEMIRNLSHLSTWVTDSLKCEKEVDKIAEVYCRRTNFLYLGRNYNYPIAMEGALKLKEISYIHAEGYPAGEMKHGPIALIDENMPIVAIATHSPVYEKILSNIEEARSRGANVIGVANRGDKLVKQKASHTIFVPSVPEELSPMINVIPLQLLAYHIAVRRGCDVDQPRNLAKSVTVE